MVKIIGLESNGKKRLHPSAQTVESRREQHPMFQYAVDEYAQAVPPGTSNDDGNSVYSVPVSLSSASNNRRSSSTGEQQHSTMPTAEVVGSTVNPVQSSLSHDVETKERTARTDPFSYDMSDATYEESYGEAYTGGPIKYVYPSGYQTMRPRSCPWKLSIFVCLLFTWLSVFIVGHCSDQVEEVDYTYDDAIDDDSLYIDIRWCGSRPLYLMWVASMLITGLSAAYCGVIGYIKVRDFAVANSRSQPAGVFEGKSDYYVKIGSNIYQSDGTPQFWGAHIYKPTQAAVAVTSR